MTDPNRGAALGELAFATTGLAGSKVFAATKDGHAAGYDVALAAGSSRRDPAPHRRSGEVHRFARRRSDQGDDGRLGARYHNPHLADRHRHRGRASLRPSALALVSALSVVFSLAASSYCGMAWAQNGLSFSEQICLVRDREASTGIAFVLLNPRAFSEAELEEAIARLRRARMYCQRPGWANFARVEYEALRKMLPVTDREIQALLELRGKTRTISSSATQKQTSSADR
jgi:hypothetical protein